MENNWHIALEITNHKNGFVAKCMLCQPLYLYWRRGWQFQFTKSLCLSGFEKIFKFECNFAVNTYNDPFGYFEPVNH